MIRTRTILKAARFGLVVIALAVLMAACAPEAPPPTATPQPTMAPAAKTEAAATTVPTKAGPSPTPYPTGTSRPVATPTSERSNKPNTVYVEGGEFILGSDSGNEDETPRQEAFIDSFNIDIYPVTNTEYKEFVDATGHEPPRTWEDGTFPEGMGDHPAVWVNWYDAQAYAEWAGKRLPTELEWEKAARGSDGRTYPWGDTFDAARCSSRESAVKGTSPVGSYPEGVSPSGAFDMAGNVWEWTVDWYEAYRGSLYELGRYGEQYKVLRGGSWFDGNDLVRTTTRKSFDPNQGFSTIGFRCAE